MTGLKHWDLGFSVLHMTGWWIQKGGSHGHWDSEREGEEPINSHTYTAAAEADVKITQSRIKYAQILPPPQKSAAK